MANKKYKVKRGDSWIGTANKLGISLNDLLYWNGIDPLSTQNLPAIHPGQEIYTSDPYTLNASYVQANAPQNYVDYGDRGKQMINNYALAVKQGAIDFNKVPKVYQNAVYQKMITNTTDKAADKILQTGLNTALFLADPIGYSLGYAGQKAAAYANDKISGRNEYGLEDIIDYTPVMGTKYAAEHPIASGLIDVGTGTAIGSAVRNAPTIVRNAKQLAQNAAAITGLERDVLAYPVAGKTSYGSVFQSGSKGAGKTGTTKAGGLKSGGYRFNVSSKGNFGHAASANPSLNWVKPDATLPIATIPLKPAIGPIHWNNVEPPVIVINPKKHIYEQQSFNGWQQPLKPGWSVGEYVPGTGVYSITGEAPRGKTVKDQALTKESIQILPGDYAPRVSKYIPGTISGTPSSIFSGLGIEYNSKNPGNLIINKNE